MSAQIVDYLESLIAKVKDGEIEIELVKTDYKEKLQIEIYEGKEYQIPIEIETSQWWDTFNIRKPDTRILS